jgi:hypothetical protein
MSQGITIRALGLRSKSAIEKAVKYLKEEEGIQVELKENQSARFWGGPRGQFDLVLALDGCPFDVGLLWNKNDNSYDCSFDAHAGEVCRLLGDAVAAQRHGTAGHLAKFTQAVGLEQIAELADERGFSMDTPARLADGSLMVTVNPL